MARETIDIRELVGIGSAFVKADDYTLLVTWDAANNRGTGKPLRLSMSELGAALVALGLVGAPGSGGGGASPVEVVEYQENPNIPLYPNSGVQISVPVPAAPNGFFGIPVVMSYKYETNPPDFPDLSAQIQGAFIEFMNNSPSEVVVLTSFAVRYLQEVV